MQGQHAHHGPAAGDEQGGVLQQAARRLLEDPTLLVARGGTVVGVLTLHDVLAYATA